MLDKDYTFEILSEEDEEIEIEIDNLEEIEWNEINGVGDEADKFILSKNERYLCQNYDDFEMVAVRTLNKLIKAVKQLNNQIKEKNK